MRKLVILTLRGLAWLVILGYEGVHLFGPH